MMDLVWDATYDDATATNGMSADTSGHLNAEVEVLIEAREKEKWSKKSLF